MTTPSIRVVGLLLLLLLAASRAHAQTTAEVAGTVTFNGAPVPGVTVTATRADARIATTTDAQGIYRLRGLEAGTWTVSSALAGFAPASIDVIVPPTGPVPALTITLLPFDQVATVRAAPAAAAVAPAPAASGSAATGTRAAPVPPAAQQPAAANAAANAATPTSLPQHQQRRFPGDNTDDAAGAADGFLINGSVNNGAASPFAQARAFGNNRPGGRALYTGGAGLLSSHSALDASQYSFTGRSTPKPVYNDIQFVANVGGPLRLPGVRNDPNAFLGYQHIEDHATTAQSGLVPTLAERAGDFSQSRQPVRPAGAARRSRHRPAVRVEPDPRRAAVARGALAAELLPAAERPARRRLQLPGAHRRRRRSRTACRDGCPRWSTPASSSWDRWPISASSTDTANLFDFVDKTTVANTNASLVWTNRLSQFMFMRARYEFTNLATDVTPHFANLVNVSGEAGITGNNQDPSNWGPPALSFSSGLASLATGNYAAQRQPDARRNRRNLSQPRPPQLDLRRRHPRRVARPSSRSRTHEAASPSPERPPAPTSPTS